MILLDSFLFWLEKVSLQGIIEATFVAPVAASLTFAGIAISWLYESWLQRSAMRAYRSVPDGINETTATKSPIETRATLQLSLVVCIRNGSVHWQGLWEALKKQRGVAWELVVVDDGSSDGLQSLWTEAKNEAVEFHVQWLETRDSRPGKKDALKWGIHHAKADHVVVTDVDCLPSSATWLCALSEEFRKGADVILGISLPLLSSGSGLLGRCEKADALRIARSYAGWASSGRPYMGVGRNMAYKKELFQGFSSHEDLPSGDDDLLIQSWLNRPAMRVVPLLHRSAQTDTHAPATWAAWSRQKQRHLTTAWRYSSLHQWGLMLPSIAAGLTWVSAGAWIYFGFEEGVLHNVLWILSVVLTGGWAWRMLNFRSFAQACGAPSSWHWLGWVQPVVDAWLGWQVQKSRGVRKSNTWD
jgi:poly-beta-1,6-N-acetyl-D-glucosamine synthase